MNAVCAQAFKRAQIAVSDRLPNTRPEGLGPESLSVDDFLVSDLGSIEISKLFVVDK